jgi:hypothetical protein
MEPGYPDLARYDFFDAKLYLTKLWLTDDKGSRAAEAEFILASPCKFRDVSHPLLKQLQSSEVERPERLTTLRIERVPVMGDVYLLNELPKRGWNHGNDVGAMLEAIKERRPDDLASDLARWALRKVPLDQFQVHASAQIYRSYPSYDFPLEREFALNAKMVAVEWVAFNIGDANPINLHILDFDLS